MAVLSLTFMSAFAAAYATVYNADSSEPQRTVRAEPVVPVKGIGSRNNGNMYQIEIGHKGVVKGNLPEMAASFESEDVVSLSGRPRSIHDGLQVLRIQQEEPVKEGSGIAVAGLGLFLASLVGIAMKLQEKQDPYADLRGGSKPLNWVRMSVHSSIDALDDGVPAMIKKHGQDIAACIGYMASKGLRKFTAKLRRMARPNFSQFESAEGQQDLTRGVQFVATTFSEDGVLGDFIEEDDSAPLLMQRPSELAGLTMEALAKQLEGAGEDELAARMLSNHSKCLALGQMRSDARVEDANIDCESESECVI